MTEVDDLQLVRSARDGDEAAFTRLVERHEARIYNLALRLMGNSQDAEEVLQDTFLQVFRNLGRFEERSRFSTWIYRIATNEALMRLRKAKRKREVFLEDTAGEDGEWRGEEIRDFARSALEDVENKEMMEILEGLLAELPEDYRVVFTLRDIDGLSNAEVAEVLEISVAAVKSRLHRSRLYLRDRLTRIYGKRGKQPGATGQ
ncbi:MAG: sigma-70 family RNA polymerase sigma factor [Gemmatimonadetes bacterium]|nr:sigma-70 family RNA polymerase sigma factor [Gemmatimonadota bacterium]